MESKSTAFWEKILFALSSFALGSGYSQKQNKNKYDKTLILQTYAEGLNCYWAAEKQCLPDDGILEGCRIKIKAEKVSDERKVC